MNDKTTAQEITQIAGRVRFSYNLVYLVESLIKFVEDDYYEQAEYYNELEKIKGNYNIYSRKHYVQKHADELEDVKEWYLENNNIDTIKDNLPMYITWTESEIMAHQLSDKSPLNEQVKNYIIDYVSAHMDEDFNSVAVVIDGDTATYDFFGIDYINITEEGQAGYIIQGKIQDMQYSYSKLCSYIDYRKINKLIAETHTLPKGVNKEILDIIDIIKLEDDKYEHYIDDLENYLKTLTGNYFFMLDRQIKNIKSARKTYSKCYCDNDNTTYKKAFDKYFDERKKLFMRRSAMNSEKTKKAVIVTDKMKQSTLIKYGLNVGDVFESCTALADKCNVNNGTVTRWIKNGVITEQK